jgi:hypothetical protein
MISVIEIIKEIFALKKSIMIKTDIQKLFS